MVIILDLERYPLALRLAAWIIELAPFPRCEGASVAGLTICDDGRVGIDVRPDEPPERFGSLARNHPQPTAPVAAGVFELYNNYQDGVYKRTTISQPTFFATD